MNLFVLDVIFWIIGIRGHIPQDDGFPAGRGESFAPSFSPLLRVLAVAIISIACLSLALWLAVWLAIKLL
jgi:hypothetical protein